MARETRTDEELRGASEHLAYEIEMFFAMARALGSGALGVGPLANAALESFTIHARTLLHFFYADKPQPDDVIAQDYFSDPQEWQEKRPSKTPLLETLHRRVGKEVAHLTYVRLAVTNEQKQWNFGQISNDITIVLNKFLELEPKHFLVVNPS
jgi:hypothetical protein